MTAILDDLAREGFTSELVPAGRDRPGMIRCTVCDRVSDASLFTMHQFRRMEGASDPAEMVAIVALRCPHCDAGGTLVLTYGPEVTEIDAPILERLPDPPTPSIAADTDEASG
jgi:hypothetical protein